MYKKTITYTDFNGDEFTDDFYFNLSKAELIKLETTTEKGGFITMLEALLKDRNVPEVLKAYDKLIRLSYGKKTPDGRQFVKREEYLEEFLSCGAYDELYTELMTNDNAAVEFIKGITPKIPEKKGNVGPKILEAIERQEQTN